VLIVFLSVLSTTLYIGTKTLIETSSKLTLERSANEIIIGNYRGEIQFGDSTYDENFRIVDRFRQTLTFNDANLKLSYAIFDQSLNMIYVRNNGDISFDYFERYVRTAYEKQGRSFDRDNIEDVDYRIYTLFFGDGGKIGVLQLYQDISMEVMVLAHLKRILMILTVASALVLTAISWFLAGMSIKPVRKAWQKQKEFVADASHELRTPLSVIQTNLDAALSDEKSTIAERHIFLDNAYTETQLMSKLVEELLMLAKIDVKQMDLDKTPVNFSEICASIEERFQHKLDEKQITLESKVEKNVLVKGDSLRLMQLIAILMDNAIKYNQTNGEIKIVLEKEKGCALFIITDTGMGIEKNELPRIFDRFYRGDKARHRENGGTGLGLSIAKWIIEEHKGSIDVRSSLDEGTQFFARIPLMK
jgi:signal transduction histidine kinase